MAAPAQDEFFGGGAGGVSTSTQNYTLVTARTNELMVLTIAYEQANSTANSVTSVTDSTGLTWRKHSSINFTATADSNGLTGPSYSAIDVWWAYGNFPSTGGSFTINFASAVDHFAVSALWYGGANSVQPFDQHSSLSGTSDFIGSTAGAPSLSLSTQTKDVQLVGYVMTPSNNTITAGTFNSGAADYNHGAAFSTGGSFWCKMTDSGKASTSGFSNEAVAFSSNTNVLMGAFAITADAQPTSKTFGTMMG
ncbi:MAG: hypothetical protein KGL39_41895 [Patescibacteria group bacterium]|nr:hypothetical protein [Patescibacteria group bacterium]